MLWQSILLLLSDLLSRSVIDGWSTGNMIVFSAFGKYRRKSESEYWTTCAVGNNVFLESTPSIQKNFPFTLFERKNERSEQNEEIRYVMWGMHHHQFHVVSQDLRMFWEKQFWRLHLHPRIRASIVQNLDQRTIDRSTGLRNSYRAKTKSNFLSTKIVLGFRSYRTKGRKKMRTRSGTRLTGTKFPMNSPLMTRST